MKLSRLFLKSAAAAAFLVCFASTSARAAAPIDLNSDGIPDLWAMRFSAGALSPTADSDGDGRKNSAEAAAGTNPFSPASALRITSVTVDGTGVHLTFPTEIGKRYQVQTAATPSSLTWTDFGVALAPDASGSLTTTNGDPGATSLFYRVRVQDIDSDGDGVNDWEEIQAGFDPYSTHSGGLSGPGDLAAISGALAATNVVSVKTTDVPITEPAAAGVSTDVGTFTITRTGNLNAITVSYNVSGGATPGSDYVALSGSVALGMGVNTATINVVPLPDFLLESPEAVIVTISASPSYTVGSPAAAAVLINDYTQANGTGLTGIFWEEGSAALSQTVLPTMTGATTTPVVYAGLNETTAYWAAATSHPVGLSNDGYWSSRWSGEVLPEFSQIYTFFLETNFAGRLYVNGQLIVNNWPPNTVIKSSTGSSAPSTNRLSGTIELVAGVRYPIVVEHYQDAGSGRCYLSWQSSNQPEQYIPATRLFPAAPPQILSALNVLLLKDSPLYH